MLEIISSDLPEYSMGIDAADMVMVE